MAHENQDCNSAIWFRFSITKNARRKLPLPISGIFRSYSDVPQIFRLPLKQTMINFFWKVCLSLIMLSKRRLPHQPLTRSSEPAIR